MSRPALDTAVRGKLSRALSECARDASGHLGFEPAPQPRPRIGITGAPGAGKSSLIGLLASKRIDAAGTIAVLAIDPTSPVSQGSVLGDRIRMDAVSAHADVFIRSLPSRAVYDGLCDNMEALLRMLERAGFGEVVLETVGAGQVQHTVRVVTDTVVMVLSPHAGDSVQAMKAGLMEMADIYVVNKADLPDAARSAMEIRATVVRDRPDGTWRPPVILTSTQTGAGIIELSEAIDRHREFALAGQNAKLLAGRRVKHHVGELLHRRLAEAISSAEIDPDGGTSAAIAAILDRFAGDRRGLTRLPPSDRR